MAAPHPTTNPPPTPTELNELRTSVERWLERGTDSLLTFFREKDASFLLDTNNLKPQKGEPFNTTTTARAYKALICSCWQGYRPRPLSSKYRGVENALESFFEQAPYLGWKDAASKKNLRPNAFVMWPKSGTATIPNDVFDKCRLNNFDVIHLTDYVYALHHLKIYQDLNIDPGAIYRLGRNISQTARKGGAWTISGETPATNLARLRKEIIRILKAASDNEHDKNCGRIPLDPGDKNTCHFFVTLHALRSLSILDACPIDEGGVAALSTDRLKRIVEACKSFCISQCFYAARESRHEFDCTSLTFALVIYISYSEDCDKDLINACLKAISNAQTVDGSWPATHPIVRKGGKPWHITSHELALSLSWLYFQPRLLDTGRNIVLGMLRQYFENWVVKTHVKVPVKDARKICEGWFDDHTITRDFAAGWVTAIVCDFLGNYRHILCDYINRQVIQTLGIETSASHYLIDEDAYEPAKKWKTPKDSSVRWPDLPPLSWPREATTPAKLAATIRKNWTDPKFWDDSSGVSGALSELLSPVINKPSQKLPPKTRLFLLPGPPGTRKTSLVKSVPRIAGWPLVTVPSATFFEDGFDHLLTRATQVFRNLGYLRQCVVFFDEFEEFFRERFGDVSRKQPGDELLEEIQQRVELKEKTKELLAQEKLRRRENHQSNCSDREFHDRTVAAFITSSMLPHLQILHDEGRCLVFVATNSEDTIDRAIQRPGRFDLRVEIPHPMIRCLRASLSMPTEKTLEKLEIEIPDNIERDTDGDPKADALSNIRKWKKLAADMNSLLDEPEWRDDLLRQIKKAAAPLFPKKVPETPAAKASATTPKTVPQVSALQQAFEELQVVATTGDQLRIPFNDFDAALKALSNRKRAQARKKLSGRLDYKVPELQVQGDKP